MNSIEKLCPCGSGDLYSQCCRRLHEGALPENALALMRSRYSAYVLNLPDYIIATTHPASREYSDNKFSWKRALLEFSKNSSFHKLEVLDFKENGDLAMVVFTAWISQEGQEATFTEKSFFEKVNGRWLYLSGQLAEGHAPQLITSGPLRLLRLAYYGDPLLRRKADPLFEITDEIKNLVEEMIETMDASNGMGLAAPQVHRSIRLFVMRPPIETEEGRSLGDVKVFINPELSSPSLETWKASEGCLSIPHLRASVERPKEVTVEYTSLEGERIKERFFEWEARVILHESDHIDGVLFIDRLDAEERAKLDPFLQRLKKRLQSP